MGIKSAEFLISVSKKEQILDLGINEFVFVGRSNCGKSSLINYITDKKNLAKTSSTPGLTKLINYFLINSNEKEKILPIIKEKGNYNLENKESFLLVDLPGYGYSKAGKINNELWSDLIGTYLKVSKNIKKVFILVDIRHEPSEKDKQMIQYLYFNNLPFVVVATKADKIAKTKLKKQISMIANSLKLGIANIITCSIVTKTGKNEIISIFEAQD
ncbi:MAG: GTP-binding protein [Clostridia bacterium]|nr:GTP-binding protein [Clostridia bacterium]